MEKKQQARTWAATGCKLYKHIYTGLTALCEVEMSFRIKMGQPDLPVDDGKTSN